MTAAIFGLGLIGGSFALALRDHGIAGDIVGVDASAENAAKALELGLVDRIATHDEAVEQADLIVLATPVDVTPILATRILNRVRASQTVMDMGSIKEELCEVIEQHPARGRFVATHPMWGTEFSGPAAAQHGAFTGRTTVICDRELSAPDALGAVEAIWARVGSPVIYMSAAEQDLHAAYISHISHITSFALALTVLEKEREEEHIFDLAGGGFESTVRLAKSSPDTWLPIFAGNKYNVLDVLREHIHQLQILRRMLERNDREGLRAAMQKANTIKRILP
ncbi:MAG: prephenate dehydrogenase [Alistipes sp.]|jgi:prephenate dehydrogenase|nr:prephenate dehydrogenase [Alistipes sp.]